MENKFICQHCSKLCISTKSVVAHSAVCSKNPTGKTPWSKGKSKDTDVRLQNLSVSKTGKKRENFIPWWSGLSGDPRLTGKAKTAEAEQQRKDKLSEIAKENKFGNYGGYKQGSGRGKKGWYKGIFCDSSWELAFVIYCIDHGKQISRCKEIRYYEVAGVRKKYYPDFIVDGSIIEIKGYITDTWLAKHSQNSDIICISKSEIKQHIDYVIHKYGKDYVKLYKENTGVGSPTTFEK